MADASQAAKVLPADGGKDDDKYMTANELRLTAAKAAAWKEYDNGVCEAAKCCGCCGCGTTCIDSCDVTTTRGTVVEPCGPPRMCGESEAKLSHGLNK